LRSLRALRSFSALRSLPSLGALCVLRALGGFGALRALWATESRSTEARQSLDRVARQSCSTEARQSYSSGGRPVEFLGINLCVDFARTRLPNHSLRLTPLDAANFFASAASSTVNVMHTGLCLTILPTSCRYPI